MWMKKKKTKRASVLFFNCLTRGSVKSDSFRICELMRIILCFFLFFFYKAVDFQKEEKWGGGWGGAMVD